MTEAVAGIIRHALTFVGGLLVTKGYLDPSMVEQAVGAIVTIVGLGWSIHLKLKGPPK